MTWPVERTLKLVALWHSHSASELGRTLGVGRGAICGQAARLGLDKAFPVSDPEQTLADLLAKKLAKRKRKKALKHGAF